jgi:2-oxoglutarate-Fe(II)-dependent dioxygenase family protein
VDNHVDLDPSSACQVAWADLQRQGYALISDNAIGLGDRFRSGFSTDYFNPTVLHHDEGDMPVDRQRARDVVKYNWRDAALDLAEHDTITITDRADIRGPRTHTRVRVLEDQRGETLVRRLLELVPPPRRQRDGTFGVNLFRTFTDVVSKPHHDDEEFIILYVVDRVGDGAETYLYHPDDVNSDNEPIAEPLLLRQLNPGDIIIFEDKLFKHGATRLQNPAGGPTRRDVLVCTVDYETTYLAESQPN